MESLRALQRTIPECGDVIDSRLPFLCKTLHLLTVTLKKTNCRFKKKTIFTKITFLLDVEKSLRNK